MTLSKIADYLVQTYSFGGEINIILVIQTVPKTNTEEYMTKEEANSKTLIKVWDCRMYECVKIMTTLYNNMALV